MFANIYDLERDPAPQASSPLPIPQDLSPNDLMRQGLNRLPGTIVGPGSRRAVRCRSRRRGGGPRSRSRGWAASSTTRPSGARVDGTGRRAVAGAAPAQPVVAQRGDRHRVRRPAPGRQGGGRLHQRRLPGRRCAARCGSTTRPRACRSTTLPMAVPVNLRSDADPAGGNRFAGVNLAAPIGLQRPGDADQEHPLADDAASARSAPSTWSAPSRRCWACCPTAVLESMAGSIVNSDVQASNVPVYPGDTFIAGSKDLAAVRNWAAARCGDDGGAGVARRLLHDHHPLRPRRRSPTTTLWARCLLAGFDEVLALAATVAPHPHRSPRRRRRTHLRRHRTGVRRNDFAERTADEQTMRLPGSVAEIEASPPGPRSARSSTWTARWSPASPA